MDSIKALYPAAFALLLTIASCPLAFTQDQQGSALANAKAAEESLYADAHPYLDYPAPQLERAVPELRGLEPAGSQENLPDLLTNVGEKVKELVHEVPSLIASETVDEVLPNRTAEPLALASSGRGSIFRPGSAPSPQDSSGTDQRRTFSYIILVNQAGGGRTFEEYRTDRHNKTIQPGPHSPSSIGFASMWVVFSPANRDRARFRYLGEQRIGGHRTFVLAFADLPGAASQGTFSLPEGGTVPLLYQGVAWIDPSDFRILRLRTDLLAPQLQAGLQQLTAIIHFGLVHISELPDPLWLPQEVNIRVEARGIAMQELHRYSKYRLFRAKARILPATP